MIVSESSRIAAAQSYIDALVSHNGDSVPFAAGCTRIEQGVKNGFSGNHLRRSLNRGAQYRLLKETTPPEYKIDGDRVHAVYAVLTKAAFGARRLAARVDETFVIPAETPSGRAEIQHISVRFHPFIQR
ncbi:hypothetical protein A5756_18105 [Mycobacterium sp. 852002-53434_SCH5985345]|uniref:hypothetical protein n=1 Tax=unclassified Mycobacterium TaxID=2642494 RepID=UPI0008001FD1|nr:MULTISPECIES: hypothetical protein [unclassified Mycobacterium]OBF51745.1 hypothetical protein A5756_18105 [Mycobacterium sp. 852002-53434_SCH5985345]OBF72068.1 hypothetical protein A5750_18150 [Mycobacterium sp. 852002-51613_SCH5001154]OBF94684.1 hypothetical protein A5773_15740 [Mycobacterium sp. 852014-52450_SCH5900713]